MCPGTPGASTTGNNPLLLSSLEGGSALGSPPSPYAPVGVGGWHLPGLDALQGALTPHHHAQVGVLVGVVALGLRGAVGAAGPTGGEQPVNCGTRGKAITHCALSFLLRGISGLPPSCLLHGPKPTFQGDTRVGARNQSDVQIGNVEDLLCARP